MAFRDEREAQRARVAALETEVAALRAEVERADRERDAARLERDRVLSARETTPAELIADAVDERRRERERARLERQERERVKREAELAPRARERLRVVWNLRRGAHLAWLVFAGVGWLGVAGFAAAFGSAPMLAGERAALQGAWVCALASGVAGTVLLVRSLVSLRRFRAALPFVLDARGWAKLVADEHFWIDEFWHHVVVGIEGGSDDEVAAVLAVLVARANRTFYGAEDPADDARVRWAVRGRKARGSANRHTAYALVKWCQRDLAPRVRRAPNMRRVTLSVEDERIHVSRPSSS